MTADEESRAYVEGLRRVYEASGFDSGVKKLVEVYDRLGVPKTRMPGPGLHRKDFSSLLELTCACGKLKPVKDMPLRDSGVVKYLDNICDGCPHQKSESKMAVIVCVGCRQVVARMDPFKDKTGFEFKSGKVYHVDMCPTCGNVAESTIIEKHIYHRRFSST